MSFINKNYVNLIKISNFLNDLANTIDTKKLCLFCIKMTNNIFEELKTERKDTFIKNIRNTKFLYLLKHLLCVIKQVMFFFIYARCILCNILFVEIL